MSHIDEAEFATNNVFDTTTVRGSSDYNSCFDVDATNFREVDPTGALFSYYHNKTEPGFIEAANIPPDYIFQGTLMWTEDKYFIRSYTYDLPISIGFGVLEWQHARTNDMPSSFCGSEISWIMKKVVPVASTKQAASTAHTAYTPHNDIPNFGTSYRNDLPTWLRKHLRVWENKHGQMGRSDDQPAHIDAKEGRISWYKYRPVSQFAAVGQSTLNNRVMHREGDFPAYIEITDTGEKYAAWFTNGMVSRGEYSSARITEGAEEPCYYYDCVEYEV